MIMPTGEAKATPTIGAINTPGDLDRALATRDRAKASLEQSRALLRAGKNATEGAEAQVALARADHIIAPSQFLADRFVANGFPDARMTVMAYGLEPDRVQRRAVQRPRSPLRLAFAGILSPWKSPHLLVDAVRALPNAALEATLHGPLDMEMFRGYIDDVRRRAEGDARIRFAGAFDATQTSDVLAETDVLVVPSTWYENTPFVILEAFEAGVPVVAAPKSVAVLGVSIWDDAAGRKLNEKPKTITVIESLSGKSLVSSGLTMTSEEQMQDIAIRAAAQIQVWLEGNKDWF